MKLQAPIQVEIKVGVTDGNGMSGEATFAMPKGQFPTEEEMRQAIEKVADEVGPDLRLMDKREWWDFICPPQVETDEDGEQYSTRFAIPGGEEWSK